MLRVIIYVMKNFLFSSGHLLIYGTIWASIFSSIDPYMDEVFHLPQAQAYCEGRFDQWNEKITTFPGLYLISVGLIRIFSIVQPIACSVLILRGINLLLSALLMFSIHLNCTEDSGLLTALLYHFPLNAFYYLLYYTDTMSTTMVLLAAFAAAKGNSKSSSIIALLLSSCSILARQTNAVWLLFIAGVAMLKALEEGGHINKDEEYSFKGITRFVAILWKEKLSLLLRTWPLLLPIAFFACFVAVNGSIVVGDRSNHVPALHLAMVAHALFLYGVISLPFILLDFASALAKSANTKSKKSYLSCLIASKVFPMRRGDQLLVSYLSLLATLGFLFYSLGHPFLLADNRHYTFYIWKRFLDTHEKRVLLCPLYLVMIALSLSRLLQSRGYLWLLIYLLAVVLSLAPSPLLELRYFNPSIMFAMLNSPQIASTSAGKWVSLIEVVVFIIINFTAIYVFAYRSFTWGDGSVARFMY